MVHQRTCKSLTGYMERRAEVTKLSYILEYCICAHEYLHSFTFTAGGTKQTAHLYYWFQVTTVFLDDLYGTFSACLRGFVS